MSNVNSWKSTFLTTEVNRSSRPKNRSPKISQPFDIQIESKDRIDNAICRQWFTSTQFESHNHRTYLQTVAVQFDPTRILMRGIQIVYELVGLPSLASCERSCSLYMSWTIFRMKNHISACEKVSSLSPSQVISNGHDKDLAVIAANVGSKV